MSSPDNNDSDSNEQPTSPTTTQSKGITSRINDFMDQQRLERLKQCQEIDVVLKNCQSRRRQLLNKEQPVEPPLDINQTTPGTRMMRYFGWHEENKGESASSFSSLLSSSSSASSSSALNGNASTPSPDQQQDESKTVDNDIIPTCAKETHALWACRSVCLGCSPHLRNLKDCLQLLPRDVVEIPQTNYEPNQYNGTIPCRELQQRLNESSDGKSE